MKSWGRQPHFEDNFNTINEPSYELRRNFGIFQCCHLFFFSLFLQPDFKGMTFTDLPLCLQLDIMQRLSDGRDIVSLGQVTPSLQVLSEDRLLWKKLCHYHFTDRQVNGSGKWYVKAPKKYTENKSESSLVRHSFLINHEAYSTRMAYHTWTLSCFWASSWGHIVHKATMAHSLFL